MIIKKWINYQNIFYVQLIFFKNYFFKVERRLFFEIHKLKYIFFYNIYNNIIIYIIGLKVMSMCVFMHTKLLYIKYFKSSKLKIPFYWKESN